MLDKRLPYFHVLMRADWTTVQGAQPQPLPDGYRYRTYRPGDETAWAHIETSVGEFDSEAEAQAYFARHYLPYAGELPGRMWFVLDQKNVPCATASAWRYDERKRHWAALHWVAVRPDHQGKGLGRAITSKAMAAFPVYEPGQDIYLHTQTWSYPAIGIYLRQGFYPLRTETFAHHQNEYVDALRVLSGYMHSELYDRMVLTAR